ncbi:DUF1059 domain-containing protein [Gordonia rhizosphera]|uniref:DUF1059 domain-containing protein n=1 Tax=Gordonia rhizosphera NBRC 16068 TaxID=1108045 RepID=K6WHE9_9ACTN|nr:DUF1059 domain-containing protein [Gordonia rhizosphera]GAB91582.1 hypothetical protein GORHZ_137_00220 [Gordonia rhizosphera NBRC 16068]
MAKLLECPCGTVVESSTDDELVALAQTHARTVHRMEITREQVLEMAQPSHGDPLGDHRD